MAYTAPTAATFKAKYPAFASVLDATVEVWLAEAATECASWPEDVRARAEMLYTAHRLAESGAIAAAVPAGVVSFRSGDFSATLSESAASRTGFAATIYGREFSALARRYFGGPMLAWTPPVPDA